MINALILATENGDAKLAELLYSKGANLIVKDEVSFKSMSCVICLKVILFVDKYIVSKCTILKAKDITELRSMSIFDSCCGLSFEINSFVNINYEFVVLYQI